MRNEAHRANYCDEVSGEVDLAETFTQRTDQGAVFSEDLLAEAFAHASDQAIAVVENMAVQSKASEVCCATTSVRSIATTPDTDASWLR